MGKHLPFSFVSGISTVDFHAHFKLIMYLYIQPIDNLEHH